MKTNDQLLLLELPLVEAANLLEHSPFEDELCVVGMTYSLPKINWSSDFEKFSLYWIGDPSKKLGEDGSIKLFLNVGETSFGTIVARLFTLTRSWQVDLYEPSVSLELSRYEDIFRYALSLAQKHQDQINIAFVLSGKAEREFRKIEPNIEPITAAHNLMKLFIHEANRLSTEKGRFSKLQIGVPGTLLLARKSQLDSFGGPRISHFLYKWEQHVADVNVSKALKDLLFHPIPRMVPWAIENTMLFLDAVWQIERQGLRKHKHLLNKKLNVWRFRPLVSFTNRNPYFTDETIDSYRTLYLAEIDRWRRRFREEAPSHKDDNGAREFSKEIESHFDILIFKVKTHLGREGQSEKTERAAISTSSLLSHESQSGPKIEAVLRGKYRKIERNRLDLSDRDISYFTAIYEIIDSMTELNGRCIVFYDLYCS